MSVRFSSSRLVFSSASAMLAVVIICGSGAQSISAQQMLAQATVGAPTAPRAGGGGFAQPEPINFDDHDGWTQIFDGTTLDGWDGPTDVWSVADGAIVGTYDGTRGRPTTYIIWKKGGEHANFEMKLEIKLEGAGANGGVQIRSILSPPLPPSSQQLARVATMPPEQKTRFEQQQEGQKAVAQWNMKGPQPDFDWINRFTGNLYEQGTGRGEIAWRGQVVEAKTGQKPRLLGTFADGDALKGYIRVNDWNQWQIIASGNTITQIINGHLMSVFINNDPTISQTKGLIGLEIEGPGVLKISHRNMWIKDIK